MITPGSANPLLITPEGYQISRSVRLRSSAGGFFNRTPASASNRQTMTFSCWLKRGTTALQSLFTSRTGASPYSILHFNNDKLLYEDSNSTYLETTAVFRDPSAWYHFVMAIDTTQATASNRVKMYVNGSQITSFGTATYPAQNANTNYNVNAAHAISSLQPFNTTEMFDGYLTEVNFIDGQALTPSSFGEINPVTGVWQPKKYAGTYGTNGFYLNFSDPSAATAAAIGKDSSGNGNNWTPNNISVTAGATYDSMLDVPTMWADGGTGRGNYAVLNAVMPWGATVGATLTEGNSKLTSTSGAGARGFGTMGMTSGKWYWEAQWTAGANPNLGSGIVKEPISLVELIGYDANSWGYYCTSGGYGIWNNGTRTAVGSAFTANSDILGVAFDADAGSLYFYKNGTLIGAGASFTGLTGTTFYPAISANASTSVINFGQRPFAYTPPTGFKALNTQNLPDSLVLKGSNQMNALLDTGANIKTTANAAYTYAMQWIKDRANANNHQLADTVRGLTAILQSNTAAAETTYTAPTGNSVGWVWNAGSAAVSNTAGSITSQVSANTTAGFSVVTYTGTGANATVGHGLGVAPKMIVVKNRSVGTTDWDVFHASMNATPQNYYMRLSTTMAAAAASIVWNNTAPTPSVFTVGSYNEVNGSGNAMVAYLFAEVAGFSKFGSYTGNGSTDGPFVYCGFRPRYIMIKRTDTTGDWWLYDTSRSTYNAAIQYLFADTSGAEVTDTNEPIDFLSNGFKLRVATFQPNTSGGTFIFAAFAENPFKNSLAR